MKLRWMAFAALLGLSCSLLRGPAAPSPTTAPPAAQSTYPAVPPTPTRRLPPAEFPVTPEADGTQDQTQRLPLREAFAGDAAALPGATRYWIQADVTLDPSGSSAVLDGVARIRFTQPLARPLDDLVLMLWPNDAQYSAVATAGPAMIDGHVIEGQPLSNGLGLRFRLNEPLAPGASVDVSLPFRVEASAVLRPAAPGRFGFAEGVLIAPTFYPLVPRLSPGGEWQTQAAPPGGDTTNSEVAFYDVRLTVPAGAEVAATGSEIERNSNADGTQTVRHASGPVRDFAFALGPLRPPESVGGDPVVRAWVLEEHADAARPTARVAARAVQVFEDLLGPYPYHELDVIDAPGAFGGIEYPGLVYIGVIGEPGDDLVIVHEVAHQWFYALIGNDQLDEPWLDEAAASYAEVLYLEAIGEPQAATGLLDQFRLILRASGSGETPIGLPISAYATESDYGVYVYLKGALFLDALRSRLGEPGFRAFLRNYAARHRYGLATSASFQETAEAACACDLDDLFDLWVYQGGDLNLP